MPTNQANKNLTDLIRGTSQPQSMPVPEPAFSAEESRQNTRAMLEALGHDPETIESIVPGTSPDSTAMDPTALDSLDTDMESAKIIEELRTNGFPIDGETEDQLKQVLKFYRGGITGLAEASKWWKEVKETSGEKLAEPVGAGKLWFDLGLASLDHITRFDNTVKLAMIPDRERREELAREMLPKFKYVDPRIETEFSTVTGASLYMMAQKMYGAASQVTAVPVDMAASFAGLFGADEAESYLRSVAQASRDVGKEQASLVPGALPAMVSGMAPMTSWRDVRESAWNADELDEIYQQFDNHGQYGTLAMGALAAYDAALDVFGAPSNLVSGIPTTAARAVPKIVSKVKPGKHAEILRDIAERSFRPDDAMDSYKAAKVVTERAQKAVDSAGDMATKDKAYVRLARAREAESRAQQWLWQFEDPGEYENLMLRPERRNPAALTDEPVTMYPLSAGGRTEIRAKDTSELIPDAIRHRMRALHEEPTLPVDWAEQHNVGAKQQRLILGADDAEYAGDALNFMVRGATIDDVTVQQMMPEYSVLPDVKTSLSSMRKIEAQNKLVRAEQAITAPAEAIGETTTTLRSVDMLMNETKEALGAAKRARVPEKVAYYRDQLKQFQQIKRNIENMPEAERAMDDAFLPKKQPGIMDSPERLNNWLEVAGDRVVRAFYPGALNLNYYNTKLGQAHGIMRETRRYYETYDPAAGERVRSTARRWDQSVQAIVNKMQRASEDAGLLTKYEKFDRLKHFSPHKLNEVADLELFTVLNTRKTDKDFKALYDGLSPELQKMHDLMRQTWDHFADLLGISDTDRYLMGYAHHFIDPATLKRNARDVTMLGLPTNAEVFAGFLLNRKGGADFKPSAVLAMDIYARAAYRKILLEPLFDDIIKTGKEIAKKTGNIAHVTYARDLVADMKGKPAFLGAKIDEWLVGAWNSGGGVKVPYRDMQNKVRLKFGKKPLPEKILLKPGSFERGLLGLTTLIHTSLLSGNPRYPLVQIASGLSTTAGRYGMLGTLRGLMSMATKEGQMLSKAAGTYKPFTDVFETKGMRQFSEFFNSKVPSISPFGIMTNTRAEEVSRAITSEAARLHYMKKMGFKTWKEAVEAGFGKRIMFMAAQSSDDVNHAYGVLGRNPWVSRLFGSSTSRLASQFLSYIPKQLEEIASQTMREPGRLLEYLTMAGWVNRVAANSGINTTSYLGLGFIPDSVDDFTSPAVDAAMANIELLEALNSGDPNEVRRAGEKLTSLLPLIIPGSQAVLSTMKAGERLSSGQVRDSRGNLIYEMQMSKPDSSGIGGEFLPTFLQQQNLRETLQRRALDADKAELRRFGHNTFVAVDRFVDAVEAGDMEEAAKIDEELINVYRVRLGGTSMIDKMFEARHLSQAHRNLEGNEKLRDIFYKIHQEHGIGFE